MLTDPNGTDLILAIDQGTSATKALVVDLAGRIVSRAAVPLGQSHPGRGRAEQDPAELWSSVERAVITCIEGVDATRLRAIGLSTQRESTLLWERATGRPLGPVLGWQDTRGADVCNKLRAAGHSAHIQAVTGLPLDPMFSASKATWLLNEHDPNRSRSRRGELCIGTVDSWLLWQMNDGDHLIEVGNASRTQLLDIATRNWDPELLELFAVPTEVLPQIVTSTGPFGQSGGLTSIPHRVPVTGVLGDSHAALFAHGGWHPGKTKVTYGTGSSVMSLTGEADTDAVFATEVARTIAWEIDRPAYALEGNIRSSGGTLAWLARLFHTTPNQVAAMAGQDSEGVVIVPAFTGLGAPWWDDDARGVLAGLSEGTTLQHIARAALESIALQVEDVIAAIERNGGSTQTILADGGPSSNAALMQLQADVSQRGVSVSHMTELSALGAAYLAGLGTGTWSLRDLDDFPRGYSDYHATGTASTIRDRAATWNAAIQAARELSATSAVADR